MEELSSIRLGVDIVNTTRAHEVVCRLAFGVADLLINIRLRSIFELERVGNKQVRHAKSKATNDFMGTGSATYVDSKTNTRQ